jgi:hypothetical protein
MNLDYINRVTSKYGYFTLSNYLNHSSRNYSTYLIDYSLKDITHCDGLSHSDLKEHSKEGLNLNQKGLCALYGERNCSSSTLPVEVFMIEKNLWESNDEEKKELVIFHEVCHLLEKRGYHNNLNIQLSDYEIRIGTKLNKIANDMHDWGYDEDHN